jgi:hypothetical protein
MKLQGDVAEAREVASTLWRLRAGRLVAVSPGCQMLV